MTPAVLKFFEAAADQVTVEDVVKFCPHDPGYPEYVRTFESILTSRVIPLDFDFDISETINLTQYSHPEKEFQTQEALRFRRFRIFTNAVGLAIILGPNESGWLLACNYYAINLIEDIDALEDDRLEDLLLPVLVEMYQKLSLELWRSEESLFYLLAQLLIGFRRDAPRAHLNELADQLMTHEAKLDLDLKEGRHGFLWQRTTYDQMHPRWKHFVEKLFPPVATQDSISRLREALLAS
ncbi:hypothetical protein GCM10023213_18420 [Prosthecobacter algae]|uniref:Uncharacterized protein n=1 Tax=Prosthecobacter algae TaxID=1144682 RepID=A0ABP9P1Q1_9BACT